MRTGVLVAVGIVAYGAFLAATVPARLVVDAAAARSAGAVQVLDAQGTLWNGRARLAVSPSPGGRLDIDALTWRWQPAALAAGKLSFATEARGEGLEARGDVGRGFSTWSIQGAEAQVDATKLARAFPIVAAWKPEGRVKVAVPALAVGEREVRGDLVAEWREAALALSTVRPLGAWRLAANGQGDNGRLVLTTISGPLLVSGEGSFALHGSASLAGTARAEGPDAATLEPLLDLIGPRRPDGSRTLALRLP